MTLDEYLKREKKRQIDFAAECGVSVQMVNFIVRQKRTPSLPLAQKIVEATGGQVGYEDLIPTPEPQPSQVQGEAAA